MPPTRAFVAVPIGEALSYQARKVQQELHKHLNSLRLTRPEQFHLTLAFFAELQEEQVEIVKENVLSISRCFERFSLTFDTLGAFPSFRRTRVLWLGASTATASPLHSLQVQLIRQLRQAGIGLRRQSFHPHLTLGRLRQPQPVPVAVSEGIDPGVTENRVDKLVLYASRLTPQGAAHSQLLSAPLLLPSSSK